MTKNRIKKTISKIRSRVIAILSGRIARRKPLCSLLVWILSNRCSIRFIGTFMIKARARPTKKGVSNPTTVPSRSNTFARLSSIQNRTTPKATMKRIRFVLFRSSSMHVILSVTSIIHSFGEACLFSMNYLKKIKDCNFSLKKIVTIP